jgi:hypothetical protein
VRNGGTIQFRAATARERSRYGRITVSSRAR